MDTPRERKLTVEHVWLNLTEDEADKLLTTLTPEEVLALADGDSLHWNGAL